MSIATYAGGGYIGGRRKPSFSYHCGGASSAEGFPRYQYKNANGTRYATKLAVLR